VDRIQRPAQGLLGDAGGLVAGGCINCDQGEGVQFELEAGVCLLRGLTRKSTGEVPTNLHLGQSRGDKYRIRGHQFHRDSGVPLVEVPFIRVVEMVGRGLT